jgi:radical SAM protein with 4Fe4S-binding SPASM domain
MRGSIIANYIDDEYRRRKFYENKKRQKCIIDEKRQCEKCKYLNICEDKDEI